MQVSEALGRALTEPTRQAIVRSLLRAIIEEREAVRVARLLDPWLDGVQLPQHNEAVGYFLHRWSPSPWLDFWLEELVPVPVAVDELPADGTPVRLSEADLAALKAAVGGARDWPASLPGHPRLRARLLERALTRWAEGADPKVERIDLLAAGRKWVLSRG